MRKKDEEYWTHLQLLEQTIINLRAENVKLVSDNKKLKDYCMAFSFILPEPHKDILDALTHTELYRVQHKMAKKQWIDWFNENQTK
jgi:hypothetical protein